jgi:phage-related protein
LLGVFVFGVFTQVAVLFGLANPIVDLFAMDRVELVELFLELLQPLSGQDDRSRIDPATP